jgi:flagellar basal-body rod protein FlgB
VNLPIENVLQSALNGLSLRQQIVADNIANADTPGFKARAVSFEDQLSQAIQDGARGAAVPRVAGPTVSVISGRKDQLDRNTVDIDQELLSMTDTTMRYNAVSQALSQRLALYNAVVSDPND